MPTLAAPTAALAPVTPPVADLAAGWALLHEAGEAVADLAQLGPDPKPLAPRDFAALVHAAGPVRVALVERGIDDCAAILHTGINAIINAHEAGRETTAAALTLWREFDAARDSLLSLTERAH
ncbi:hypothetical protein [Qipengyuania sp.]|uniref:hypothetical protein n=1 Tax=Qipengyuania sp. TaxID=2004515 RepID=UPI0035C7B232